MARLKVKDVKMVTVPSNLGPRKILAVTADLDGEILSFAIPAIMTLNEAKSFIHSQVKEFLALKGRGLLTPESLSLYEVDIT